MIYLSNKAILHIVMFNSAQLPQGTLLVLFGGSNPTIDDVLFSVLDMSKPGEGAVYKNVNTNIYNV